MNVTIVTKPELKAIVLKSDQSGPDVRGAWKKVLQHIQERAIDWNRDLGYVFIPEWQWPTGVMELWVGVEVESFQQEHNGDFELFSLPGRRYASIRVQGDRDQMHKTYQYLNEWFQESGYERDMTHGSFGFEANLLNPVNPFDIPADQIDYFDFEIYAPIKEAGAH